MAQLNVVVRTLIRIAFGTALPSGTHQDALQSYVRATQLRPERLIHRQAFSAAGYHTLVLQAPRIDLLAYMGKHTVCAAGYILWTMSKHCQPSR